MKMSKSDSGRLIQPTEPLHHQPLLQEIGRFDNVARGVLLHGFGEMVPDSTFSLFAFIIPAARFP